MLHRSLTHWHWAQSLVIVAGVVLLLTAGCEPVTKQTDNVTPTEKPKRWLVTAAPPAEELLPWGVRAHEEPFYTTVEQEPEYPGGNINLLRRLDSEFRYPSVALASGLKGFVSVKFIVERDGTISNVRIERGAKAPVSQVAAAQAINAEALRLVRSLHEYWKPGQIDDQAIRSEFSLPITFDPKNYPVVQ